MQTPYVFLIMSFLSGLLLSNNATADNIHYITDNLSTFTRTGPSDKFKIAGSLNSGDPVDLLKINPATQYAQIKDAAGNIVWLPFNRLSNLPSAQSQLGQLKQTVQQLTSQLSSIDTTWQNKTSQLQQQAQTSTHQNRSLQEENHQLKEQLAYLQRQISQQESQLDHNKRKILLQWFTYGGLVALGGVLLGLILPVLMPKRKNKRWMN